MDIAETDNASSSFCKWLISMDISSTVGRTQIPRVPASLRNIESNKKYFDPMVVSLGPYHHGQPHLRRMHPYKLASVKRFTGSSDNLQGVEKYYEGLKEKIVKAKEGYDLERIPITDEEFAWVMFMDTCFILDFVNEYVAQKSLSETDKSGVPQPHGLHLSGHDMRPVARDMFLLENQLPLTLLTEFWSFKVPISSLDRTDNQQQQRQPQQLLDIIREFVNLLLEPYGFYFFHGRQSQKDQGKDHEDEGEPIHILDCLRRRMMGKKRNQTKKFLSTYTPFFRSVAELKEAGIKVRKSSTPHLIEGVDCKSSLFCRELILPMIVVDDTSKYMFLNMIAFEMGSDGPRTRWITSYACLMDSLIDSKEDVKELRSKSILRNCLGSDEEVAEFFNALTTNTFPEDDAYGYVTDFIEENCRNKIRVSLANLWHTTFNTPWKTVAFLVAFLLLGLTVTQTFFTVVPRK